MVSFSMLLEAAFAAQECHAGSLHQSVLHADYDKWNICVVVKQAVNCLEASFVQPSEDDDNDEVNASSRECRVLHKGISCSIEWLFCCDWTWVVVDIVFCRTCVDSTSHFGECRLLAPGGRSGRHCSTAIWKMDGTQP